MNSRLQQFLSAENISQAQFADTIGVARASVSHILAGRNRPGFDFIERMAKRFPSLNLEWLITGKGKMYKTDYEPIKTTIEEAQPDLPYEPLMFQDELDEPAPTQRNTSSKPIQRIVKERSISRIVVFYDDNTFQELK